MSVVTALLTPAHVLAALAVVLGLAWLGGRLAALVRLPVVVGEIATGLLAGPALLSLAGPAGTALVLPAPVLTALRHIGTAGLALYLVGVAYQIRAERIPGRAGAWVTAGALVPPLACGLLTAAWVWQAGPELRGTARAPALVLLLAVAMAVTAVPVLARILTDRGMLGSDTGRLAMAAAVSIDILALLLLAIAVELGDAEQGHVWSAVTMLACGGALAAAGRWVLRTEQARRLAARSPGLTAAVIGGLGVAAASVAAAAGFTAVFGAVVVGLAIPGGTEQAWREPVRRITAAGHQLVPAFFLVAGVTLLSGSFGAASWATAGVVTGLAIVGKVGGSYAGARLGGLEHWTGLRLGVLMNTRGLTEIVVLQAGLAAGILTVDLFLAMLVMTLVTTSLTGPVLSLIDSAQQRRVPAHESAGYMELHAPDLLASPGDFRSLMASLPTGVAVITTLREDDAPWGMTCSSVTSVTLTPPTLLICLQRQSPTLRALLAHGRFAVNLLHERSRRTAELFASGAADRFDLVRWQLDPHAGGPHLTLDAHAVADCRVSAVLPVGDHEVVFGEVTRTSEHPPARPLLYGLRSYAAWPAPERTIS